MPRASGDFAFSSWLLLLYGWRCGQDSSVGFLATIDYRADNSAVRPANVSYMARCGSVILWSITGTIAEEEIMIRRHMFSRLSQVLGAGLLPSRPAAAQASAARKKLKVLMRSSWGSDEPTRASFPFEHALALSDAGHDVQIFLTGEATNLMRRATVAAVFPVGWAPLSQLREKIVAKRIPVFS